MTDQQQRSDYQATGPTGQPAASQAAGPDGGQQSGLQTGGRAPAPETDRPGMGQEATYQQAGGQTANPDLDRAGAEQAAGADGGRRYADPQAMMPQDERAGDFQDPPAASSSGASAASGASQATDPGLADQAPGGPAGEAGMDRFRDRWASVQAAFVDDPKNAVGEADRLVAEVIQNLEQSLTRRREEMQGEWTGGETDTEHLRRLLHGYRSLFQSLVDSGF